MPNAIRKRVDETTQTLRVFYNEKKQYQPIVAFIAGFTWDSLTLTRIDLLLDNLIMFSYLVLAGLCIFLMHVQSEAETGIISRFKKWYPSAIQFFLGGLFSAYIVFYFQSASITRNWLFLLFLIVLLLSNEVFKNRLNNFFFQLTLYYLAVFSFFIFILPVLFSVISAYIFLLSGLLSSMFMAALVYLLYKQHPESVQPQLKQLAIILGSVYFIFNLLYFTNLIPPVPLSLKEAGVYHHVSRVEDGYKLRFEQGAWYEPFKESDDVYNFANGDTVFCFASVFAPTDLNTQIFHHWQKYNSKRDDWQTTDRRPYKIRGGRDGGYRGYTFKQNVTPGLWRVDVETARSELLGRLTFEIQAASGSKPLFEEIYR